MNYSNLFKIAIRAIFANKMRSFLTALGIIIGVASVITMLAIGQGSKRSIQANIAEMGSNMIMISPGADMRGGVRQDPSAMETLKMTDYQNIKDECNYIKAISPTVNSSGQWIYGNNNTQSTIYGVNRDYLDIRQLSVDDGEMFTDQDIKSNAKVCVLGRTVVDYLFPDGSDPVGKVVRFNSIPFRVVVGAEYIFNVKFKVAKDTEKRVHNDPEKFFFEPTGYKRDGLNIYAGLRFNF